MALVTPNRGTGGLAIAINDAVSPRNRDALCRSRPGRRQQLDRRLGARLWITRNRGATWEALRFPDGQHPQILRFAKIGLDDQRLVVIATDDGLWIMPEFGGPIRRLALDGHFINMISPGATLTLLSV